MRTNGRCSCGAYTESSSGFCPACIARGVKVYSSSANDPRPSVPAQEQTALIEQLLRKRAENVAWEGDRNLMLKAADAVLTLQQRRSELEQELKAATDYPILIRHETDGRWIADFVDLPGVMAYGQTRHEAIQTAVALALRVMAERVEHDETRLPYEQLAIAQLGERWAAAHGKLQDAERRSDGWMRRYEQLAKLYQEAITALREAQQSKHDHEACIAQIQKDFDESLRLREELPAMLREIEEAAWRRSWSRLRAARKVLRDKTGIELTGNLTAALTPVPAPPGGEQTTP